MKTSKTFGALLCVMCILLMLVVTPAYAGSMDKVTKSRVLFRLYDVEDRGAECGSHYVDYDILNFRRDKTYEIHLVYDFSDIIDLATVRMSISIPEVSGDFFDTKDMWLNIYDLNGTRLVHYHANMRSKHFGSVPLQAVGVPMFFNENYPDGVELSEKLLDDGAILNDIDGIEKGYITITVSTESQPKATEENTTDGVPKEDDSWMVYLSITILAVALIISFVGKRRVERDK